MSFFWERSGTFSTFFFGSAMEVCGLEEVFDTVHGKIQLPIYFLERPSPGHFSVISLSMQLFR